jgi:transketolase
MRKAAMQAIHDLARRDRRVVFIGSDLGAGVLDEMRCEMPERFFMEGVSEAAIIGMAAGLALEGFIPYVNTIATFITRRAYEQVAIDLCLHRLPVRLIGSGGGMVYASLGPTHLATDDLATLRVLPHMTIVAPVDAPEMRRTMDASLDVEGPVYVRVAKGGDPVVSRAELGFSLGSAVLMRDGADVMFVGTGIMTARALAAADLLASSGTVAGVLHVHTIKPFDDAALRAAAAGVRLVVTVEEHSLIGGLGSAVAETFSDAGIATPLLRLGLPDAFSHDYGSQDHALAVAGLAPASIASCVNDRLTGLLAGARR